MHRIRCLAKPGITRSNRVVNVLYQQSIDVVWPGNQHTFYFLARPSKPSSAQGLHCSTSDLDVDNACRLPAVQSTSHSDMQQLRAQAFQTAART